MVGELVYKVFQEKYDKEWNRFDSLDGKARTMLAVLSLEITSFALTLNSLKSGLEKNLYLLVIFVGLTIVFLFLVTLGIVSAIKILSIRKFPTYPHIEELLKLIDFNEKRFCEEMSAFFKKAIRVSEKVNGAKIKFLKRCTCLSLGAVIILSFLFVLSFSSPFLVLLKGG